MTCGTPNAREAGLPRAYEYHRPKSLAEALRLKARSPDAAFVAGGTDLMLTIRRGAWASPSALVSLRSVPEVNGIAEEGEGLRIGAAVPVADVARHATVRAWFPALSGALSALGCRQIRNVATVGGNLCRASPCADSAPPLLVHEASVVLASERGTRTVPLDDFFRGPGQTVVEPDEMLTAVLVPKPVAKASAAFLRKSRVRMDLSTASLAVLLVVESGVCRKARVAAGSVAPIPLRLRETERVLEGSRLDDATIARARKVASEEVLPITDVRSTAEYRRHLIGVFLERGTRIAAGMGPGTGVRP